MKLKTLFFLLLLYVCLVWVWAFYGHAPDPEKFGLFWTAVGIVVLILGIVGTRLLAVWRLWRAKKAASVKAPRAVDAEEATIQALIAEANASLAKAPGSFQNRAPSILSMPLYLLVGSEHSKTNIFLKSGLEPQALTGQDARSVQRSFSAPCSFWLVGDAIFVDLSERLFGGDLARWRQLLAVLCGKPTVSWRQNIWGKSTQGTQLCGVVGVGGVEDFTADPDSQTTERRSEHWRERLGAIGEQFGIEYPYYHLITKCESIRYFTDYFRRLPGGETRQPLGFTFSNGAGGSRDDSPDQRTKWLTRSFRSLYISLAARRISHLAHEPDPAQRPSVYEFPREFNRVRSPLVQFLTATFRPYSLGFGPILRGCYFTGMRETEASPAPGGDTRTDWSTQADADATVLFNADATRIFNAGNVSRPQAAADRTTIQPLFVADVFRSLAGQRASRSPRVDTRIEQRRRILYGIACGICALLCLAFVWSWISNRTLLYDLANAASGEDQQSNKAFSLAELQSLDKLREQVLQLTTYDRQGPPIGLRWELYSGGSVLGAARANYFRRFQQLIMNGLNGRMVATLKELPANPNPNDPQDPAYRNLKAHLMIACADCCKPDPAFVSAALKAANSDIGSTDGVGEQALVNRQIDFYASELPYGNPVDLREDVEARDHARQYLRRIRGIDRIYADILASAERGIGRPQRLGDIAPDYPKVLSGSGDVSSVFSHEGWNMVEKASKEKTVSEGLGESCVVGNAASTVAVEQDESIAQDIQRRFVADYISHWRGFVEGVSILHYNSPADAAQKLGILTSHRSPLLAIFSMTADATSFPAVAEKQSYLEKKAPAITKLFGAAKKAQSAAVEAGLTNALAPVASTADINRYFQSAQTVVPPNADTWVNDGNAGYIDALTQLGHSMEAIAESTGNATDPAVQQAAAASYQKAIDTAAQISRRFRPEGADAFDTSVQHLLEEPILLTKPFLVNNTDKNMAAKVNGELRNLCAHLGPTIQRYPFRNSSGEDARLEDLTNSFAPGSGAIWRFQAQSLGDLTVKDGSQWKVKDPVKRPQVAQSMLTFLNRAQAITDAFYPAGATSPQLVYVIRPKLDSSFRDANLELDIDGHSYQWTSSLQKQFTWPAPPGTTGPGAVVKVRVGPVTVPVASRGGLWGIFRIMGDAEPRPLADKVVEWKYLHSGDGRLEPIEPAPVRVEIVDFPGGIDLFNPRFFDGLQCPVTAVQ